MNSSKGGNKGLVTKILSPMCKPACNEDVIHHSEQDRQLIGKITDILQPI